MHFHYSHLRELSHSEPVREGRARGSSHSHTAAQTVTLLSVTTAERTENSSVVILRVDVDDAQRQVFCMQGRKHERSDETSSQSPSDTDITQVPIRVPD